MVQSVEERKRRKKLRNARLYQQKKEIIKEQNKQWRMNNPGGALVMTARARAKKFGLPCDLQHGDLEIPQLCPVLGIPLVPNHTGTRAPHNNSPTVDRLVPEKGYVRGNVVVMSMLANQIKNCGTPEQVMAVALWMQKNVPSSN